MRISVIIPVYNGLPLVLQTLESVFRQMRPPEEVIVVDDGSTDDLRAALLSRWGDRIRYHRQDNAHTAAARNRGFALSTGDYLCFLDMDDLLVPEALAALEQALEAAPEAALAYCLHHSINGQGEIYPPEPQGRVCRGSVWKQLVDANFLHSPGAALIRRSHLLRTEPWDVTLRGVDDWDMFLRLAEFAPFVCVPRPLFHYRVHGGNAGVTLKGAMRANAVRMFRKHLARNWKRPARLAFLIGAAFWKVRRRVLQAIDEARRRRQPETTKPPTQ